MLEGKAYTPPSSKEKIEQAVSHLHSMIAEKGERVGLAEAKKHIAWYTAGEVGSAKARADIMTAESSGQIEKILIDLLLRGGEGCER